MIGLIAVHSAAPGGTLATLRERLGGATAFAGLRVTDMVIEGRANTPEPLLRAALAVSKGDPILGFSLEQARQRIESLSWVEHATVERRLPGTVVVNLTRAPSVRDLAEPGQVRADRSRRPTGRQSERCRIPQLPLVVGPGAPAGAATLIDALTDRPELQKRVVAAVRVGERRWNLQLNSGTDVMLPEGHEVAGARSAHAASTAARAARSSAGRDRPAAADRLVLRPRANADAAATPPPPKKPT